MRQPRMRNLGELPDGVERDAQSAIGYAPAGGQSAPMMAGGQQISQQLTEAQSNWATISFIAGLTPIKIQQSLFRKFWLIQNKSATGTIYVGFGMIPSATNGLELPPAVGYEPFRYPSNDIWVVATENNVQGLMIYGT